MPLDGMTPNEEAQLTQFLEQAEAEPSTATAGSEHDFFESNLESPDEVIEGLVRGGQWVVVAGLPNVGKSPMLADTTVRIIRGISWYGRSVSPRPVITFDLESNGNTYRLNILKVAERFQVDTPTVPDELEPYLEHDDPERYPRTKALMEALALGRHEPLFPQWSLQNRPTGMARDGVVLPLWDWTRQARFSPPTPRAAFEDVAVMEQPVQHGCDGGAITQ